MSKCSAAYKFTGFKYLRPNYDKPGSDSWSRNWVGYLTPVGKYWDGANIKPFSGIQVSIVRNGGKLVARQRKSRGQYRYNGIISPAVGGPGRFLTATTILLNSPKCDILSMITNQESLRQDYKLDDPVVVGIM